MISRTENIMSHCKYYMIALLPLLLLCASAAAQESFTEGCIVYTVTMDPGESSAGITSHSGTYRIYIRNRMIRKELELDNGYRYVLIWDGSKRMGYSLQTTAGKQYAVQLTREDMEAPLKKYRKFTITDLREEKRSIAGHACQPATVRYTDGTTAHLCYTKERKLSEPLMYEWLPGISSLPLSFEIKNEAGILMRFHSDYLLAAPMERSLFRVPEGFHIISNEEYKRLTR